MKYVVRIASEVNLKSNQVKARFLRRLLANIDAAFRDNLIQATITNHWSRLLVESNDPEALNILLRIFGIASVSPIELETKTDMESLEAAVSQSFVDAARGKTICVRIKKGTGTHEFRTETLEARLGAILASKARGVNLKNPEFKLCVEIHKDHALFFSKSYAGPGGLPLGVEGKALALISGGFDSPVAAWEIMKRGVALDFVFFNLAGLDHEAQVVGVAKALASRWGHGLRPKLHIIDFSTILKEIRSKVRPKYTQVVLKRAFYKCASLLAKEIPECLALVTGEAIGQVSSQTLANLVAIEEASSYPVLRPLVTSEKDTIIAQSRRIEMHDLCEKIKEYCAIVPKNPITHAVLTLVKSEEEDKLDPSVYASAIAERRIVDLHSVQPNTNSLYVVDHIPDSAIIIDTRTPAEFAHWHFPGSRNLAFSEIEAEPKLLQLDKVNLLICPIGLQTAALAERLQLEGIQALSLKGGATRLRKIAEAADCSW